MFLWRKGTKKIIAAKIILDIFSAFWGFLIIFDYVEEKKQPL